MKKFLALTIASFCLSLVPAFAQFGPRAGGQHLGGAMDRLYGKNQTFTAGMEIQTSGPNGGDVEMHAKLSFDTGKSRMEMNMSEMRSASMPPGTAERMKEMGMDSIITITRPDLKLAYFVYPGLNSYAQMPAEQSSASVNPDDFKVESTELGKEAVGGHDCTKNKVTVTDKEGAQHEFTVWQASDLKDFPVKVVTNEGGKPATILFNDIAFAKPAASLFDPPSGYTKYDSVPAMMQAEMMKKRGGGAGAPPPQH
jgi:hypothetical protein